MNKPGVLSILLLLGLSGTTEAQERKPTPYAVMAPVEQYLIANAQDEIALARSAAPASISADAEVLVLAGHGYTTAVKGKNGFVCFVERSWAAGFDDAEFWNHETSRAELLQSARGEKRTAAIPATDRVGTGRSRQSASSRKGPRRIYEPSLHRP